MKTLIVLICLLFVVGCSKSPTQSYPYIDQDVNLTEINLDTGESFYSVSIYLWIKEYGKTFIQDSAFEYKVEENELEKVKREQWMQMEKTLEKYKKWKNSQIDNETKFTGGEGSPSLSFEDDINSGMGGTDEFLEIITEGELIIRFSFSTKKVIGMDGRTIGYLNDEEAKLLENFFQILAKQEQNQ